MPFHFNDLDVVPAVAGLQSALIVPCRLCPAASLAMSNNEPWFELFRTFLRTAPYERHIRALRSRLEKEGVKTKVFESYFPHQFPVCMWTSGRRKALSKRAKQYEAVIVIGCEAATDTVRDAIKATDCQVFQGMETAGVANAELKFHRPGNISLELNSVTGIEVYPEETILGPGIWE